MRIGEEMKNEPKCLDSCRCWCGDLIISRTHDEDDYTYGHMFVSKFHAPGCPNAEVPKVEWGTDPSEEMGPNEVIAPCGCRAERSGDGKLWSPIGHTCQPAPAPKPKQGGVDFKAAENWAKINAEVPDFSNDCNMARAYLALRAELAANQHDCPNAPAAPMVDVGPGSEWQREAEDNGHRLAAPAPEKWEEIEERLEYAENEIQSRGYLDPVRQEISTLRARLDEVEAERDRLKAHALVFPADLVAERDALRAELARCSPKSEER